MRTEQMQLVMLKDKSPITNSLIIGDVLLHDVRVRGVTLQTPRY